MQQTEKASCFFFIGNDVSCAYVMTVLVRSLSHVSSCATTKMMLTVWQSMCVYYPLLLSATTTATIIIDGGSSSVGWWCTCVRVILCSKRVTHSRDFFSSSTCYSYTTMMARIHTHNEEDLPISVTQAIIPYTHT